MTDRASAARTRLAGISFGSGLDVFGREPIGLVASDVQPERITWIWSGRLAAGKMTLLDGDPGLGKSTVALEIAARITHGQALPGGPAGTPRGIVLLSAEDGAADTIVPRLRAAGAELERVFIMSGVRDFVATEESVTLPAGLDAIERAIKERDAALLIVDPLMAFLGDDTNAHRDQDVRRALAPMAAVLERTGSAGLFVRHLNKTQSSSALYRGGGSIGIIGAARFGLLIAKDPEDDDARIIAPTKCNIGPHPNALRFRLLSMPGTDVARVDWDSRPVSIGAAELLAAGTDADQTSELGEAREWLADYLATSARPVTEVKREARKVGFSDITLRRAKDALGARSKKSGFGSEGRWVWVLPDDEIATEDTDLPKVITQPIRCSLPVDDHLRQEMIILGDGNQNAGGEQGLL